MGKSYRPYLPEQGFLLPPSLREWLPENHLVYLVSDVVDNLNLSALDAAYGDEQRPATRTRSRERDQRGASITITQRATHRNTPAV